MPIAPCSIVEYRCRSVRVLAASLANVVAPSTNVVIAVGVEILAVTFALVVNPLT
jgi:hypothetical protein